jgi:uncharacterized protein (DUF362 family)
MLGGAGLFSMVKPADTLPTAHSSNRIVTARYDDTRRLDGDLIGTLVDSTIVEATGAPSASDAWSSLFSAEDSVSIKVNCLSGPAMSTDPRLVRAVVERLKRCGIREGRIIIWDRSSRELKEAGFKINIGGSGVQCYGTNEVGYGNALYEKGSVASLLSRIITERCNKVINMPILKHHGICGITFAMKNHFGSINNPNKFHLNRCNPYIGDLNSMKQIRGKSVLIIGDLTRIQADGGPSYKSQWAIRYGGVLVGLDPVATDHAASLILEQARRQLGRPSLRSMRMQPDYIISAEKAGAGTLKGFEHIVLSI